MQIGDIVFGKITGIKNYGAFVQVDNYSGLVHISEFSDGFVKDINDIVSVGEIVAIMVIEIDEAEKKLKLSFKKANVLPSKLLDHVHIYKGFNALQLNLDKWVNEAYEKISKGEQ